MELAIEMKSIQKSFNSLKANDNVDFQLAKGEIHALLGENGAGKTTLMNILYGLYKKDAGEIFLDGEKVKIKDPNHAITLGIGMVHQHFMLVDTLTVYENIILGYEKTHYGFLVHDQVKEKIEKLVKQCGFKMDLNAKISNLPIGVKQRVEIVKILFRGANVLIMDEPTAVLTPQEVDELFITLNQLKKNGHSIIFITHKMRETFAISDRVTVMRKGKKIETLRTKDTTIDQLTDLMVGHSIICCKIQPRETQKESVLKIVDVSLNMSDGTSLKNISMNIRAGEILGIAGVDGNGQSQLVDIIIGAKKPDHGKVYLNGLDLTKSAPSERINAGVALIPDDRHRLGIISDFNIMENLLLGKQRNHPLSKYNFLSMKEMQKLSKELIEKYDICPPNHKILIKNFSGGNQQKVIVARQLSNDNLNLVVAFQPTRGLDIGAVNFVHNQLLEMREKDKAILLISTELDEIRTLSDRIAVIFEGCLVDERLACDFTEKQLGLAMAGKVQ